MISYIEEIKIGHRIDLYMLLYDLREHLRGEDDWDSGLCHHIIKRARGVIDTCEVVMFIKFSFINWPEGSGSTNYPIKVKTLTGTRHAVTQYDLIRDYKKFNFVTRAYTYFLRVRFTNKRKRLLDYMIKILEESIGEKMQ